MTVDEYRQAIARYRRLHIWPIAVFGLGTSGLLYAVTMYPAEMTKLGTALFGAPNADWIRTASLFVLAIAMLATSAAVHCVAKRDRRLSCSHCNEFLVREAAILVVIATGNCTGCGRQVITSTNEDDAEVEDF